MQAVVGPDREAQVGRSVEPAEDDARLGGDEASGGPVPGVQALLDVGVEAALGERAEVERGGPDADTQ